MKSLILLALAAGLFGQAQPGLQGTVMDTADAVVTGAKVTLRGGAEEVTASTNAEGRFEFPNLAPGDYVVRVKAKGMATLEQKVKHPAARALRLALQPAEQTEQVTVTATKSKVIEESIDPERNADRLNFDEDLIAALPSPGQNPLSAVAAFTSPAAQGAEGLNITVDGMETSASSLPAQSIRRIRVNRNPYSLQFRRPGKARVEVYSEEPSQTRYKGTFGFSARDSVFDARNAFAPFKPDLRRTLADLSLGGPLVAKRTTFFLNGERYRNTETAVVNARTLSGPFVANVLQPESRNRLLARIEERSENHTIVALYSYFDESEGNRGAGGLKLPEQGIPSAVKSHRIQFSDRALLAGKLLNDLRGTFTRESSSRGRAAFAPAIVVQGAFTGGPAQTFREREETALRIQDIATITVGKHTLRFGGEVRPAFFRSIERSNFGGTYEFANLDTFAAAQPILYRVNRGTPDIRFAQHEVFGFVQDETRIATKLMATYGFRYSWQSDVDGQRAVAPRVGLAWSPGGTWVVRGGAGVFHERVTEDVQRRSLLWDGARLVESLYRSPSFPLGAAAPATVPASIVRGGGLLMPALTQASVSVEREVFKRTVAVVEYQHLRGVHLLRSRNVNAPLIADPRFLNINQVESSASLRSNSLSATFRGSWKKWLSGMAQYTFSRTYDDTSGPFEFPANGLNLRPEWGRSDYDQRHRFNAALSSELPGGWRIGAMINTATGGPFDITTGRDDNGDSLITDRPSGVTRNTGQAPGRFTVDLRITKLLRAPRLLDRGRKHTSRNVDLSLDAFNLLNNVNYVNVVGVTSSRLFGLPSGALTPRVLQLSLRYRF